MLRSRRDEEQILRFAQDDKGVEVRSKLPRRHIQYTTGTPPVFAARGVSAK
jgi:hypothetical protein